jgi:hypothetical protein
MESWGRGRGQVEGLTMQWKVRNEREGGRSDSKGSKQGVGGVGVITDIYSMTWHFISNGKSSA